MRRDKFWRSAKPALRGTIVLALITSICYRLHLNFAVSGFLYLIALVLNCLDGDFLAATIVSLLAVGCLDFFFIEPLFSLTVTHPLDMVALASFLITSLVITRLASKARNEARVSRLQRRNMELLYDLAQRLLALQPLGAAELKFLEAFLLVFGLKAACIFDASTAEIHITGNPQLGLGEKTREAYILGRDSDDLPSGVSLRCLRVSGKTTGAIGFEGLRDPELMAGPLAALAAAGLERARTFRNASQAAAQAQAEALRGAILDALAHEFKTPLATILTAAGGLREAGPLGPEQRELAEIVETEASRLGRLTSRLLRLARLDREEVKPRMEAVDIAALVTDEVDRYSRMSPDRRFSLVKKSEPAAVLADGELFRLALDQLLDNACKYSRPDSEIQVSLELQDDFIAVTVWNTGSTVAPAERNRIFERFYRGDDARRRASGSGLGLYVARKITLAHGGTLDLDPARAGSDGTAFRLTIPAANNESGGTL